MTAASGIQHEEFHSQSFTERGGTLEMVQLWVNLPARDKMSEPGYQTLLDRNIPMVMLPDEAGRVRVIAGEFDGRRGPAHTHTPMSVWDVRLQQGRSHTFDLTDGHTLALVVLRGRVRVNGTQVVHDAQLATFDRSGTQVTIEAESDATLLLLAGEPIDEPVVGYGPFVMNSAEEIRQAMIDFENGRFGAMVAP
jgi:redox-sensitive bicupin YhaK (pirin superfamily)